MTGVVEHHCPSSGEKLVKVRICLQWRLLQQAIQSFKNNWLIRWQLGIDLGPQRLNVAEIWVTQIRRDPIRGWLGNHAAKHRVTVCLDESGHEHCGPQVRERHTWSSSLTLGNGANGDNLAGGFVDGDRLGPRI